MGVRNRGTYSGYSAEPNRAWGLLRGAAIMLLLAALSFALGFFVLSHMMPGAQTPDKGAVPIASGVQPGSETRSGSGASPSVAQNNSAPSNAPAHTVPKPSEHSVGPSIDPADEGPVQQPDSLDKASGNGAPSENGRNPFSAIAPSPGTSGTGAAATPSHRRKRRRTTDGATVQTPDTPDRIHDGDAADNSDKPAADESNGDENVASGNDADAKPAGSVLYHIQSNVFSTREAADREAQRIRDKGFPTSVQPILKDGRTLYRLRHGTFRNRADADAARQSLSENGVDSIITNR